MCTYKKSKSNIACVIAAALKSRRAGDFSCETDHSTIARSTELNLSTNIYFYIAEFSIFK